MDAISTEALNGLAAAVRSLLPEPADANLKPSVLVQATSISPAGIGGIVGINHNPEGDIIGRRIEAIVEVGIRARADGIGAALTGAINSILAADRAALLNQGILKVAVHQVGDRPSAPAAVIEQSVGFRVLYEYLKKPADSEDIIREIPLNVQLQQ